LEDNFVTLSIPKSWSMQLSKNMTYYTMTLSPNQIVWKVLT
jgi:hypothetical protein